MNKGGGSLVFHYRCFEKHNSTVFNPRKEKKNLASENKVLKWFIDEYSERKSSPKSYVHLGLAEGTVLTY